ncbi:MAG: hypothetical protein WEB33_01365 [Bacteroidota bacterium]
MSTVYAEERETVKLYYYSREQSTIVEAKWVPLALTAGVLVCAILVIGAMKLNQSMGFVFESPSIGPLTVENAVLQRQVHLLSPRVYALEASMRRLSEGFESFEAVLRNDEALRVRARFPAPMATSFVSARSMVLAKRD